MAGFRIEGNTSGNVAEVTAGNRIKVEDDMTQNRPVLCLVENDSGADNPDGAYVKGMMVSESRRLKVGIDNVLFGDTFQDGAINGNKYIAQQGSTGLTITQTGNGYINLNGGAATTASAVALLQTRNQFQLYGNFEFAIETDIAFSAVSQPANCFCEWGIGQTANTVSNASDGVFFRLTNSGIYGVVSYNAAGGANEVITPILKTGVSNWAYVQNKKHRFEIVLDEEHAEFWIDGSLRAEIDYVVSQISQPMIYQTPSQPIFWKIWHNASGAAAAQTMKVASVNCMLIDVASNRKWETFLSSMGQHCSALQNANQTINGVANSVIGTNATINNSTAAAITPPTGTPSATTAALGNSLGGLYNPTWLANTSTTDYILCSYQVPLPTTSTTSKKLIITGCRIDLSVGTVASGGTASAPIIFWHLAYGSSAISLATADLTNSASPTKAYRRLPLGIMSATSTSSYTTAGTALPSIITTFQPITVMPGEFVALAFKPISGYTGGTLPVMWVSVMFDGFWE